MAKINPMARMDSLPVKEAPFADAPEIEMETSKYGWSPSRMSIEPSAQSFLDWLSSVERENQLKEERRMGILEGLLQEAGK